MPNHRPRWQTYLTPILTALVLGVAGGAFRLYLQVQILETRMNFYHGAGSGNFVNGGGR